MSPRVRSKPCAEWHGALATEQERTADAIGTRFGYRAPKVRPAEGESYLQQQNQHCLQESDRERAEKARTVRRRVLRAGRRSADGRSINRRTIAYCGGPDMAAKDRR